MRALSREQLDSFLTVAQCCVVSHTPSDAFDAYVLSESSLFVYADKLMIKTCGTTALLAALPLMLRLAAGVGCSLQRLRYSRSCFRYAETQPPPHRSWAEECQFLDAAIGAPTKGAACVLGGEGGLRWHLYAVDVPVCPLSPTTPCGRGGAAVKLSPPTLTLEICMTQLCPERAALFMFGDGELPPAASVSAVTGITALFPPETIIDDFLFSPCGYSMNGLLGPSLASIHVTPEARCSYASVEVSGVGSEVDPDALLRHTLRVFRPGRVSVALTVDAPAGGEQPPLAWAKASLADGYSFAGSGRAELPGGGWVSFLQATACNAALPALPAITSIVEQRQPLQCAQDAY